MFVLQLVQDLLKSLPTLFEKTMETQSALGSALQAAFKLLSPTGGRMSVFQTQLPNLGVGALQSREDPNQRASAKVIWADYGLFSLKNMSPWRISDLIKCFLQLVCYSVSSYSFCIIVCKARTSFLILKVWKVNILITLF